jgi:hypothetical protein
MASKAEIVAGLNQFADTLEKIGATYEASNGLPSVQLLRQAKQVANLAPKLDASSPAVAARKQAGRYARELERLSELKPTRWEPPKP